MKIYCKLEIQSQHGLSNGPAIAGAQQSPALCLFLTVTSLDQSEASFAWPGEASSGAECEGLWINRGLCDITASSLQTLPPCLRHYWEKVSSDWSSLALTEETSQKMIGKNRDTAPLTSSMIWKVSVFYNKLGHVKEEEEVNDENNETNQWPAFRSHDLCQPIRGQLVLMMQPPHHLSGAIQHWFVYKN